MSGGRKLRVGIDVGGTFTDVVAIDAATRELVARVKVPTTHDAARGVAEGIVAGIEQLLADSHLDSASVAFIAHSTTQATNALLEGDLARVGVLGLLDGLAWLSRRQMRFRSFSVSSGEMCIRDRSRRVVRSFPRWNGWMEGSTAWRYARSATLSAARYL